MAYLDLQIHLESREPLGMKELGAATLLQLKAVLTLCVRSLLVYLCTFICIWYYPICDSLLISYCLTSASGRFNLWNSSENEVQLLEGDTNKSDTLAIPLSWFSLSVVSFSPIMLYWYITGPQILHARASPTLFIVLHVLPFLPVPAGKWWSLNASVQTPTLSFVSLVLLPAA